MTLDYRLEYQRYKRYYTYLAPVLENPVVRAYFSVTLTLLTVAIFLAFAIRPTVATIASLSKEISDKRELSTQMDAKINALSVLQIEYRGIEDSLPLVTAALPQNPALSQAVYYLEKTATISGIKTVDLEATKAVYSLPATHSAVLIPFNYVVTANDYQNFSHFLTQLKKSPRLFSIDEVTIYNSILGLPGNQLSIKMKLELPFLP